MSRPPQDYRNAVVSRSADRIVADPDEAFFAMLAVKPDTPPDTLAKPHWSISHLVLEARDRLSAVTSATVHCDGACEPNPGPGGWGLLIDTHAFHRIELCGSDPQTTNNRMEMTAAIVALTVLPPQCAATIVSDSQYLIKGATIWMAGWKLKNYRRGIAGEIPNADLWRSLDALVTGRRLTWKWVRGHNGHDGNERADLLATIGLRQIRA